ncbi:uncharacterized protein N7479_007374 [Penicillium vulpinum]|uniref:BZIP domain-containing protein n=1 Tax=Penicillium vulpinum TaxID=29845 RepID=A0A1V6SAY9_9EURO|nr:uncharacterized protein N7479_007374 [Penicillium vulpinum]KAJ5960224.1 hypothetical protein N7479_007374 [Penicillium vulpinum]OQE10930.1 hypothetical protein PENVUL_c003G00727 [Penicillium vulpinum]
MSHSRRAGSLSRDVAQTDDRASDGFTTNRNPSRRPPNRPRPQSWHPYGPVEPPLESISSRPIGVHAILNHPQATADLTTPNSREPLSLPGPSSPPRPQGTSPTIRSGYPLVSQPLSPRSHSRPSMNPASPSARFVGGGGRTSGQSSVAQSPLVPHEPLMGPRLPVTSSPLPLETGLRPIASLTGTQPSTLTSLHSRRTSAGQGPRTNPNSQETSPSTSHSTFSPFGRASPAVTSVSLPQSTASYPNAPPYMSMDPLTRSVPTTKGPRRQPEQPPTRAGTPQTSPLPLGMIPCVLDMRSGSSSQAEKRKANSDASRRFRNRKRNEMQLEQRLTAQQDEIQRNVETVRRQSEELRSLIQQRDHYRSERDFYRDHIGRTMSLSALPPRPPSPRSTQPTLLPASEPGTTTTWSGADAARSASGTQPISAGPPSQGRMLDSVPSQPGWPASPPYSSTPIVPTGRAVAGPPAGSPSVSGGPLPPLQGSWPRP